MSHPWQRPSVGLSLGISQRNRQNRLWSLEQIQGPEFCQESSEGFELQFRGSWNLYRSDRTSYIPVEQKIATSVDSVVCEKIHTLRCPELS